MLIREVASTRLGQVFYCKAAAFASRLFAERCSILSRRVTSANSKPIFELGPTRSTIRLERERWAPQPIRWPWLTTRFAFMA